MPAFIALPRPLRAAGALGYLQAVGLTAYAISIAAFEQGGTTAGVTGTDLAPVVLVALYLAFAAIAFGVSTGLVQCRRRAFTPYLLLQAFGLVVAQPLLAEPGTRVLGVLLVAVALTAGATAVAARGALR